MRPAMGLQLGEAIDLTTMGQGSGVKRDACASHESDV
jgi:hypothetical protein